MEHPDDLTTHDAHARWLYVCVTCGFIQGHPRKSVCEEASVESGVLEQRPDRPCPDCGGPAEHFQRIPVRVPGSNPEPER